MASVLPPRRSSSSSPAVATARGALQPNSPDGSHNGMVAELSVGDGGVAVDDHERELIVMLEQKHGKVCTVQHIRAIGQ